MRVPLSWLAEYVDLPEDPSTLADGLTSLGLKVDAIHRPAGDVRGVVVGEVLAIRAHPRAEKLIIVDVTTGDGERSIVCGAQNFNVGDRVPVAVVGARLPQGGQVDRKEIRGEISEGMLCSPWELGISDDHSGIMVLAPATRLGADVSDVLGLREVVLDLEITPNRPDAMSLVGVAREVAALNRSQVRVPQASLEEKGPAIGELAKVEVEDLTGCRRYLARAISGVRPGPSPEWVQRRLSAAGIRPISNIVDATNYALLVLGHPMHAFDLDRLEGRRVVVRRARREERLKTIDGEDRALDLEDLLICDAVRPIGLAGVMGGADSEISDTTERVLLESAYFDPKSILRTSKRHGLRTESSARFERGADPNAIPFAADFATGLILEWAGGEVASGVIDHYPDPIEPKALSLTQNRLNLVLGTNLSVDEASQALARVGLDPTPEDGRIQTKVPTRRPDIGAEEDLIEEVARVVGYEKIPATLPSGRHRVGVLTREQRLIREIRAILTGAGVYEAQTSSLLGPGDLERAGYPAGRTDAIPLANPLAQEESLLRPTLLPGLVAAVARNVSRRVITVRLFEIGRCFLPSQDVLPIEPLRLALALHGQVEQEWYMGGRELDLFDLKGILEVLLDDLRIAGVFEPHATAPFHPARASALKVNEEIVGALGELAPHAQERYDLPNRVLLAELDLAPLLSLSRPPEGLSELPRFPAVLLDLAVAVPEEVPAGALLETAYEAVGEILEEARIFDVYRGEQVGEGWKSIALSLSFRKPDRTLTTEEALAARRAIAEALARAHGGRIRE
jgi:phenylalanyl-tRNA synthetase beta chain